MTSYKMAQEIIELHEENAYLRAEVERLRQIEIEYGHHVAESVKHGETMMVNWLGLLLSKRIEIKRPWAPDLQ